MSLLGIGYLKIKAFNRPKEELILSNLKTFLDWNGMPQSSSAKGYY
jgi:hypothetical protein